MKIAIDPGHGMSNRKHCVYDPGAVCDDSGACLAEADIALAYGLALRDAFASMGNQVFMTRETEDAPAPLGHRASAAETEKCDVFLSLHLNAHDSPQANGVEVLYHDDACRQFAIDLQETLVRETGFCNRGAKERDDLTVLTFHGPAVLIELGFLSNPQNRQSLLDPTVKGNICRGIADVTQRNYGSRDTGGTS